MQYPVDMTPHTPKSTSLTSRQVTDLPVIKVEIDPGRSVFVELPRYSAAGLATAYRIAAAAIEELAAGNWPWCEPTIARGMRSNLVMEFPLQGSARPESLRGATLDAVVRAAEFVAHARTLPHRTGIQTHRVVVVR